MRAKSLITLLFLLVILAWGLSWYLIRYFFTSWNERSAFGDMFGAVNALFSGLAFAGLIVAIYLQTQELSLQRQELKDTREELKGQKEQLLSQNITLRQQRFENTLFQLLKLHHDYVNSMTMYVGPTKFEGRSSFGGLYRELRDKLNGGWIPAEGETHHTRIDSVYTEWYSRFEPHLAIYFRNLYNIIRFIDSSDIEDKKMFMSLVRSQLSTYELALLFYYGLSKFGLEKFKPLVERYKLLKHMPKDYIVVSEHISFYDSLRN